LNPKELEKSYQNNKHKFHEYIDNIKKNSPWDIYTIVNATLIKNPYTSTFPLMYFSSKKPVESKKFLFFKSMLKYYLRNFYLFFSYFIAFVLFKVFYKKQRKNEPKTVIDVFGLVDKVNQNGSFSENYLIGLYDVFEKYKTQYTLLLRPYETGKNPLKLIKFFKIINNDKRDFIFEYEFLKFIDFIELFYMIFEYPFKTLRLLQKETNELDKVFNYCLIKDLKQFSFESFTRYVLGRNLAKVETIEKIYSWGEFQVIERSFNYGMRKNNPQVEIIALQFYHNYEVYFNAIVNDLDFEMLSAPHKVLVNGNYYLLNREKVKYDLGVSLRYKDLFDFQGVKKEKNILLLGSYIESDTKYMLESVKEFHSVIFKNHPAVDIETFGKLPENIAVSSENIYTLFESAKLVIGTASGTAVEAVACGVSVIIIASQDDLTANPLVEYGRRKIWDIVYDGEIEEVYNKLVDYRTNNIQEIKKIAYWYKNNFFVEPTEKNIIKVFDLDKE